MSAAVVKPRREREKDIASDCTVLSLRTTPTYKTTKNYLVRHIRFLRAVKYKQATFKQAPKKRLKDLNPKQVWQ